MMPKPLMYVSFRIHACVTDNSSDHRNAQPNRAEMVLGCKHDQRSDRRSRATAYRIDRSAWRRPRARTPPDVRSRVRLGQRRRQNEVTLQPGPPKYGWPAGTPGADPRHPSNAILRDPRPLACAHGTHRNMWVRSGCARLPTRSCSKLRRDTWKLPCSGQAAPMGPVK